MTRYRVTPRAEPGSILNPHPGTRVALVRCSDPYTRLRPGTEGTVSFVDSTGTVHVDWDNGSKLGLVVEAGDRWRVIP